ncbi:MAG: COX15/CtaA family protein, partial [Acidobacteria bacterium]|nr:COX15/CtaA family protein [Acidobacteriota bacterium]
MKASNNSGLHKFAILTACWTLFLLVAGALVTSNDAGLAVPDWPLSYGSLTPPMVGGIFYEHGHRMVATVAGILTIILAVWISRRETRAWMRRLGWAALAAVVAQGLLGGLTVKFLLPVPVSVAHACLAQAFFCTVVSLALFTSRWWQSDLLVFEDTGSPQLRTLALLTVGVTFVQLALGAAFRHRGIGILPHIVWAAVVLFVGLWTTRTARKRVPGRFGLRLPSIALSALIGTQILLGAATYWAIASTRTAPQPMPVMIWFTVAHVAVGALTLA